MGCYHASVKRFGVQQVTKTKKGKCYEKVIQHRFLTLIELLVVIAIIAILAAMPWLKFTSTGTIKGDAG